MYRYKKLMVCLNLDEHDRHLVKYSGFISRMAKSEEVLFVYVYDSFDIPEEIRKIYPQLEAPPEAMVKKQMQRSVDAHFNGHEGTAVAFRAMAGPQLGMLVSCTKNYDIDLLVVDLIKSVGSKPFFKKDKDVVRSIRKFSETLGATLIVVGARGRSGNIAAILLGSITEGLIRTTQKPLLAVKEKGQGLNILEALTLE